MKSKSKQNKFVRIISMLFKALGKAKDCYVSKMTDYAGRSNFGGGTMSGSAAGNYGNLPRSFSAASTRSNKSDDYSELIRAASARSLPPDSIDMYVFVQQQEMRRKAAAEETEKTVAGGGVQKMPPRSVSVGMGRIDEDKACLGFDEEEDDVDIIITKQKLKVYPRSKSYAVTNNLRTLG